MTMPRTSGRNSTLGASSFRRSHVSLAALREKPGDVLAACQTLGFTRLFMPAVPPEQRDMEAYGWRSLGRELGGMAPQFQVREFSSATITITGS